MEGHDSQSPAVSPVHNGPGGALSLAAGAAALAAGLRKHGGGRSGLSPARKRPKQSATASS